MKRIALLTCGFVVVLAFIWSTPGSSQVLYQEHFTDGLAQLEWLPFFGRYYPVATDTIQVIADPTTPEGDGWIGMVAREDSVPCGMVWAGDESLSDYSFEAWVFVNVDTTESYGLYQGLCGRIDTTGFWGKYYRFIADFDKDQRLRLSYHYGEMMPIYLHNWSRDEIPGGVPSDSSWHKMKLKMVADSIWTYWDGEILPGCPIIHDSLSQGYFGVYVFRMWMSEDVVTRVDNIIVRAEPGIHDVMVDSIISPLDTVKVGSGVIPQAVVKNVGNYEDTFEAICRIDSSGVEVYADTASLNSLKPDSSCQVFFAPWIPQGENVTYKVFFWTALSCDGNPSNDTLSTEVVSTQVGIEERSEKRGLPKTICLYQNYPNPFNPSTEIEYALPVDCWVRLAVYNLLGQKVATLLDQPQRAGYHRICWEANITSGVYFYRLEAGEYAATRKMILLR